MANVTLSTENKSNIIVIGEDGLSARINSHPSGYHPVIATSPLNGKQYFEVCISQNANDTFGAGFATVTRAQSQFASINNASGSLFYMAAQGKLYINGHEKSSMPSSTVGTYIGFAIDTDNRIVKIYTNGTKIKEYTYAESDFTEDIYPAIFLTSYNASASINFGLKPFYIQTNNPSEWDSLRLDGYKPFDTQYYLICQDGKYYTIVDSELSIITETISSSVIDNNGCYLSDIMDNINLLSDKFKLISNTNTNFKITGLKENSELIVSKNSTLLNIQKRIDCFDITGNTNNNSNIKCVFSIDNGIIWKTYDGNNIIDLDINIPSKQYSKLTEVELSQWNLAKDKILEHGINYNELININFNDMSAEYIKFACVLYKDKPSDTCNLKNLFMKCDFKDMYKVMTPEEIDIAVNYNSVQVTPHIDCEEIKVNILPNGVSQNIIGGTQIEEATEEEGLQFINSLF